MNIGKWLLGVYVVDEGMLSLFILETVLQNLLMYYCSG